MTRRSRPRGTPSTRRRRAPDLEGGAVRGRPRVDRRAGTDRRRRRRPGGGRVRVYISVDMEGIAGINHPDPTDPTDRRYPVSVDLMVGETNAAIEGALAAGATDILVNDSHWNMYNLLPADLHPAARVLQGQKAWSMVAGARPAGGRGAGVRCRPVRRLPHPGRSSSGTIAHTYSGMPVETRLDGRPTGEYGMNALVLGAWGIPVGMVAGDDALAEEVEPWLPWAERVVVKTIDGGRSAISVHRAAARDRVRAGAERAVAARQPASSGPSRSGHRSPSRSTYPRASSPTMRRSCRASSGRRPDRPLRRTTIPRPPSARSWRWSASSSRSVADRSIERLAERAETLAGAWGARARASTTLGQERALLRLFGVTGLDRSGRPLAGAAVDRWLASARDGLGGRHRAAVHHGADRVRPRPAAARARRGVRARSTSPSRRSSCGSRTGGRSRSPRRAAWSMARSSASMPTGSPDASSSTCSARRRGRGSARRSRSPTSTRRSTRRPRWPRRASTCSASRCRSAASWPTGCSRPASSRRCGARVTGPATARRPTSMRTLRRRAASAPWPPAASRRRRRRAAAGLRPAGHGDPAAGRARGRGGRGVRAGRPRRGRPGRRDRRRGRRSGSLAGRPCLRAALPPASRHVHLDRSRAAGRGAGSRLGRAVGSGDPLGTGARAAAARRRAGQADGIAAGPDRRRRVPGVAGRRALGGIARILAEVDVRRACSRTS